jgi:two-component system NarL family response regulator
MPAPDQTPGLPTNPGAQAGEPVDLLIVHDQLFFRQCLAQTLETTGRFAAVGHAGSGDDALAQVGKRPPQIIVIDWQLPAPGALALTRALKRACPDARVLILGIVETLDVVQECVEAGAAGYVVIDDTVEQFLGRVEQVMRGEASSSPGIVRALFSRLSKLSHDRQPEGPGHGADVLTFRELQILRMIAEGLSNKQIASRLKLSQHTVKNHVHNLLEKLAADGRYAAVQQAYERRWLTR